jgi:hypothetical protein
MGIHGLTKLLGDNAHECIKECKWVAPARRRAAPCARTWQPRRARRRCRRRCAPGAAPLKPPAPAPPFPVPARFEGFFGRKIAVDASMHIYQFLIVVGRQVGACRGCGMGMGMGRGWGRGWGRTRGTRTGLGVGLVTLGRLS